MQKSEGAAGLQSAAAASGEGLSKSEEGKGSGDVRQSRDSAGKGDDNDKDVQSTSHEQEDDAVWSTRTSATGPPSACGFESTRRTDLSSLCPRAMSLI